MGTVKWLLQAVGEGASCAIVLDLREGFHGFSCCCGKKAVECSEHMPMVNDLDDDDNWTFDEAGKRFQYTWDHECGSVTVTRLDKIERDDDYAALEAALTAAEQRAKELQEALRGLLQIEDARIATGAFKPNSAALALLEKARAALAQPRTAQDKWPQTCNHPAPCYECSRLPQPRTGSQTGEK